MSRVYVHSHLAKLAIVLKILNYKNMDFLNRIFLDLDVFNTKNEEKSG